MMIRNSFNKTYLIITEFRNPMPKLPLKSSHSQLRPLPEMGRARSGVGKLATNKPAIVFFPFYT